MKRHELKTLVTSYGVDIFEPFKERYAEKRQELNNASFSDDTISVEDHRVLLASLDDNVFINCLIEYLLHRNKVNLTAYCANNATMPGSVPQVELGEVFETTLENLQQCIDVGVEDVSKKRVLLGDGQGNHVTRYIGGSNESR